VSVHVTRNKVVISVGSAALVFTPPPTQVRFSSGPNETRSCLYSQRKTSHSSRHKGKPLMIVCAREQRGVGLSREKGCRDVVERTTSGVVFAKTTPGVSQKEDPTAVRRKRDRALPCGRRGPSRGQPLRDSAGLVLPQGRHATPLPCPSRADGEATMLSAFLLSALARGVRQTLRCIGCSC